MFRKILIANRGEIACRVLRTCKRLGIHTVLVCSDADLGSLAAELADEAVRIGPAPVKESYLNVEAVLEAVRKSGAEAVHPGYGLLSENAGFARAVHGAGAVFIGPSPEALEAFGDKVRALAIARDAGLSPPPSSGAAVAVDDEDALLRIAAEVGYPLLVKAAGGGGGIGMQLVEAPEKLARAAKACSDRGQQAFSDPRVYLERFIEGPKHIEVQVLCDGHGSAIALGERECSTQRRHQKIVEEAPSAAPFFAGSEGEARRARVAAQAVDVVKSIGYLGVGTVELVANPKGELYFLEVNARLQVEHCVTEMVRDVDLVEEQLRIAAGEPMSEKVKQAEVRGHAIEARLYAEDPDKRFAPQPGKLTRLVWPEAGPSLRIETGVREGDEITPYYDPMIAKVVAHGSSRNEAIERLAAALRSTELELTGPRGPAQTNLSFLADLVEAEPFRDATYDTSFAEAFAKARRAAG